MELAAHWSMSQFAFELAPRVTVEDLEAVRPRLEWELLGLAGAARALVAVPASGSVFVQSLVLQMLEFGEFELAGHVVLLAATLARLEGAELPSAVVCPLPVHDGPWVALPHGWVRLADSDSDRVVAAAVVLHGDGLPVAEALVSARLLG